ncbi:MAG: ribonuclease H-like domain-containing protein [Acidimicrobiales bacterium]
MRQRPAVYGLDIETDTTVNGLDPAVASVVTVALAGAGFEEVFTGPEDQLLAELDERLDELEPGVIATWNGGAFDLPFIADRAARYDLPIGLHLELNHRGAYRASWYDHAHLDAYRIYRGDVGPALRISCSLKSIARFVGLSPIEVDRTRIHDLSNEALHAYAASDARLARILAERRWPTASRGIDQVDPPDVGPTMHHHPALSA